MKIRVYKDKQKLWRWSVSAKNGKIRADSGEGYNNKAECLEGLEAVTHIELLQMVKNDLQLLINAINEAQGGK